VTGRGDLPPESPSREGNKGYSAPFFAGGDKTSSYQVVAHALVGADFTPARIGCRNQQIAQSRSQKGRCVVTLVQLVLRAHKVPRSARATTSASRDRHGYGKIDGIGEVPSAKIVVTTSHCPEHVHAAGAAWSSPRRAAPIMKSSPGRSVASSARTISPAGVPFPIAISAVVLSALVVILLASVYLSVKREEEIVYRETMRTAEILLQRYAETARILLLNDDNLGLTLLVKESPAFESLVYIALADPQGTITAHSDPTKVGSVLDEALRSEKTEKNGEIHRQSYVLSGGAQVVDISTPIMFGDRNLGSIHLGLSADISRARSHETSAYLLYRLVLVGGIVTLVATAISLYLSRRLTRSPSPLGSSSRDLSEENRESQGAVVPPFVETAHERPERTLEDQKPAQAPAAPSPPGRSNHGDSPQVRSIMRNQVTVLFAGIRGFKEYAEARAPGEVLRDLNEYFSIAANAISAHGGYIDKFIGDAVVAVFESSPLQANHSERAIRSAVALQKALHSEGGPHNQLLGRVGIGISSGVVVSGNIGPDANMMYTSIGDSFKAAYSLNLMAQPGEVVISKDVYHLVQQLVSVEPVPPREKVDKSQPWENFRLVAVVDRKGHDG
jgi:class 3 adenylate cyclase